MKLSTRSRYALRLMLDIAKNARTGECISLRDASGRQDISVKYLEQIVTPLTRAGLLTSVRGPRGGYSLNRSPSEYTVGEIVRAIEGNLCPVACLECSPNRCERASFCETLDLWRGLQKTINEYLDATTLADLLAD